MASQNAGGKKRKILQIQRWKPVDTESRIPDKKRLRYGFFIFLFFSLASESKTQGKKKGKFSKTLKKIWHRKPNSTHEKEKIQV